mmetsp:Transcript_74533/g.193751  ORF Transcript_74533/g.193751 Transcript_74533/m.193751 type:complete len:284 (-) Transcript_74533:19-870(-)
MALSSSTSMPCPNATLLITRAAMVFKNTAGSHTASWPSELPQIPNEVAWRSKVRPECDRCSGCLSPAAAPSRALNSLATVSATTEANRSSILGPKPRMQMRCCRFQSVGPTMKRPLPKRRSHTGICLPMVRSERATVTFAPRTTLTASSLSITFTLGLDRMKVTAYPNVLALACIRVLNCSTGGNRIKRAMLPNGKVGAKTGSTGLPSCNRGYARHRMMGPNQRPEKSFSAATTAMAAPPAAPTTTHVDGVGKGEGQDRNMATRTKAIHQVKCGLLLLRTQLL